MTRRNQKQSSSDTVTIGTKSADAIWAEFEATMPRGRPEGEGWMNPDELAARWNCTRAAAYERANRAAGSGALDKQMGTTEKGRPCAYYRPATK